MIGAVYPGVASGAVDAAAPAVPASLQPDLAVGATAALDADVGVDVEQAVDVAASGTEWDGHANAGGAAARTDAPPAAAASAAGAAARPVWPRVGRPRRRRA